MRQMDPKFLIAYSDEAVHCVENVWKSVLAAVVFRVTKNRNNNGHAVVFHYVMEKINVVNMR